MSVSSATNANSGNVSSINQAMQDEEYVKCIPFAQMLLDNGWDGKKENEFAKEGAYLKGFDVTFRAVDFGKIKKAAQILMNKSTPTSQTIPLQNTSSTNNNAELTIEGVIVSKFFSFLEKALNEVNNAKKWKSSFLVGRTGAGKSTLTSYMLGCQYKTVEDYTGNILEPKGEEIASTSSGIGSHTALIKTYQNGSVTKEAFSDCPGFLENRGKDSEMAMNIAFCDLFKSSDQIKSIVVVVDVADLLDTKLSNFRNICERLNEIIEDPNGIKNSIFFVLTKKDNCKLSKALKSIEAFIDYVKNRLIKEVEKEGNLSLWFILNLMNENNVFFADFSEDDLRNDLSNHLDNILPIQPDSVHYRLTGNRRQDIELFIDACFRMMLATLREKNFLEASKTSLKELTESTKRALEKNEKRKKEIESRVFTCDEYSPNRTQALCDAIQEQINAKDKRIDEIKDDVKELNKEIKNKQSCDVRSKDGEVIKSIETLQKELDIENQKLKDKDTTDLIVFWSEKLPFYRKILNLLVGGATLGPFSIFTFHYLGKPYVRASWYCSPSLPSFFRPLFKVLTDDRTNGIYKAIYSCPPMFSFLLPASVLLEKKINFNWLDCSVIIKGEKRVKYEEDIKELRKVIAQVQEEINFRKDQLILPLSSKKEKCLAEIETLQKKKKDLEKKIQTTQTSDKESFDKAQQELKKSFEESKKKDLQFLQILIDEAKKTITDTENKLQTLESRLKDLEAKQKREKILHDPKNIKILERISEITGITTDNFNDFHNIHTDPIPHEFECLISNRIMVEPVYHTLLVGEANPQPCQAAFEKDTIEGLLKADQDYSCPKCKKTIKSEDLAPNMDLKSRIHDFRKNILNSNNNNQNN